MMHQSPDHLDRCAPQSSRAVWLEVALIFGLCFVYAGGPPPDVNEAHYLAKAKHYWDPSWCGSDQFLSSAAPHAVFYWIFGWVTLFCSLTTSTWIGRIAVWGLLAVAWQRLSWSVVPQRFVSVATAALFLMFVDQCHLAGEWVVGGFEAKSVAYALVLLGVRSIVQTQWRAVWLWLGAAAAVHVVVGGWSAVAAGICWLLSGNERARLSHMLPSLILGAGMSLLGLVPAMMLSRGVDPAIAAEANRIYVYERLSHHLVFHQFSSLRVLSFGTLVAAWIALGWYLRDQARWRSLNRFAVASLLISLAGVVIDVATRADPELAARLLSVYWYRLSDVAVPMAVAVGVAVATARLALEHRSWARIAWAIALATPALWITVHFVDMQLDFRPRAVRQSRPTGEHDAQRMQQIYRAWRQVCEWANQQTPADCRFLTPRNQQTFKWYANRSELVCWKDIPQDARGIVSWWQQLHEVYPAEVLERGLGSWSDEQLKEIAERYEIDYILVDRSRTNRRLGLQRVYPSSSFRNAYFEVYRVYRTPVESR